MKVNKSVDQEAQEVRITLKTLTSLTYTCTDEHYDCLVELNKQLRELMSTFKSKLPHQEGLLLRPQLLKELKLAHKKKLSKTHTQQLPLQTKRGRKRASATYRNRVGKKAQASRAVSRRLDAHPKMATTCQNADTCAPPKGRRLKLCTCTH